MDKPKEIKVNIPITDLIQISINVGVPTLINIIAVNLYYNLSGGDLNIKFAQVAGVSFLVTVFLTILTYNVLPKFKFFRAFKNYEGR